MRYRHVLSPFDGTRETDEHLLELLDLDFFLILVLVVLYAADLIFFARRVQELLRETSLRVEHGPPHGCRVKGAAALSAWGCRRHIVQQNATKNGPFNRRRNSIPFLIPCPTHAAATPPHNKMPNDADRNTR